MVVLKKLFTASAVIFIALLIVIYPREASNGAIVSIKTCVDVIIPSMFAYMVISTYIISSGIYRIIFKPLYFIFKKIIRVDEKLFSVFCLSLIGGYPVGMKLLKDIISQNKSYCEIAEKSVIFCYCISPTFSITMIGLGLYGSVEAGVIIYISNVISSLILSVIVSHAYYLESEKTFTEAKGGLTQAINDSTSALLVICSVIVVFNIVLAVLDAAAVTFGLTIPEIIKPFIEISNILNMPRNINSLPVSALAASTGGLCVILQCRSIVSGKISLKSFFVWRIPAALLSFIITKIILIFWDVTIPVALLTSVKTFETSAGNTVMVLLLIMCVILLEKCEKNFKKG